MRFLFTAVLSAGDNFELSASPRGELCIAGTFKQCVWIKRRSRKLNLSKTDISLEDSRSCSIFHTDGAIGLIFQQRTPLPSTKAICAFCYQRRAGSQRRPSLTALFLEVLPRDATFETR